jgi:hypothetical protein
MATKMLSSFDVNIGISVIGPAAALFGCDENALRIIFSLLLGNGFLSLTLSVWRV